MAGIGFALRRISNDDSLFGPVKALFHSILVVCGPWITAITAMSILRLIENVRTDPAELNLFHLITMYNFTFSLVLTSPFCVAASRFLADSIYKKDLKAIPGVLIGGIVTVSICFSLIGGWWYFWMIDLPPFLRYLGFISFLFTGIIWFVAVFLSVICDYYVITLSFFLGFLVPLGGALSSNPLPLDRSSFLLLTSTAGLMVTLSILIGRLISAFPFSVRQPFAFMKYLGSYWEIVVGAFAFNLGTWIDKWIMWGSPLAQRSENGFYFFPVYDSAMFLANLSIIPILSIFVFSVETRLYELSRRYHHAIVDHANFASIASLQRSLSDMALSAARNLLIIQSSIALLLILTAPTLFTWCGLPFLGLGIFRFGVIGSMFLAFLIFITVFLSYFDARRSILLIQGSFLLINAASTIISARWGLSFYGYGFAASTFVSCVIGIGLLWTLLCKLPYYSFIRNNYSLKNIRENRSVSFTSVTNAVKTYE